MNDKNESQVMLPGKPYYWHCFKRTFLPSPLCVSFFTELPHLTLKLNNLFRHKLAYGLHFLSDVVHFFQLLDHLCFKLQYRLKLVREPLIFTR